MNKEQIKSLLDLVIIIIIVAPIGFLFFDAYAKCFQGTIVEMPAYCVMIAK